MKLCRNSFIYSLLWLSTFSNQKILNFPCIHCTTVCTYGQKFRSQITSRPAYNTALKKKKVLQWMTFTNIPYVYFTYTEVKIHEAFSVIML